MQTENDYDHIVLHRSSIYYKLKEENRVFVTMDEFKAAASQNFAVEN